MPAGGMGAGKTTLIKAFVKLLGGEEQGNSPTFGIVNEYHNQEGGILAYHFDFYRLNNPGEALDLGLEDYLREDTWVFIEWPEMVAQLLPENSLTLELRIIDPSRREISLVK
ncbi:tRNA (adenosine(37)-N6)-threonylcarbamoyltransferase complex ATPase subunit type 1 TsaE [Muriicola soli]|uniref:tRNA (adenosine(37)-N6)-threonylcarbamoyltransferase complex ATPase subunit type 1 TsaE n=1 Tax=Muriicola soli TaxID=2507538 RepID=UPI001FE7E852|nr:tRNA (adenosine(37)-N6)-threonylcarbamoyltransferase complex ATPase subunit type 1 TsaE [Muriicola soli]